jgi:hypothetical protein
MIRQDLPRSRSKYCASAAVAVALCACPIAASAQVGYGGGDSNGPPSGGPLGSFLGTFGTPIVPQGQVLGASTFNFTHTLSQGSKGADVSQLQQILIDDGFLSAPSPTGYFGPATAAAVEAYQTAHALPATGIVGPLTRALLNQGTTPSMPEPAPMSMQERTSLILQIQLQLQNLIAQFQSPFQHQASF